MRRPARVLTAGLLLLACDAGDPSQSSPSRLAAIRAACTDLATVWCAAAVRCAAATFQGAYGTPATCVARQAELCERARFGAGSRATPEQVRGCAAASDVAALPVGAACEKWLRREASRDPPEGCVPAGDLKDGEPCLEDSQCASSSCTRARLSCGSCGVLRGAGDLCFDDESCGPALACRGGKCVGFSDSGGACDAESPCHPDLTCAGGVCVARLPKGASCTPAGENPCELWPQELACSPSGSCQPHLWAGAGEACGPGRRCGFGLVCQVRQVVPSFEASCVAVVEDRLECPTNGDLYPWGGPCRAPATCLDHLCQIADTAACSELP